MNDHPLPHGTRPGRVTLRVADLGRALDFYQGALGLDLTDEADGSAALSAGDGRPLIQLRDGAERRRPRHTTGLYHYALLVPERAALARALLGLRERDWPIRGLSDHAVSEAAYLADPDGNGIEIYADRPRELWRHDGGELHMTTDPLDLRGLLAEVGPEPGPWGGLPAGTTVGHIHLHVADLAAAEAFYHGGLGLDVTARGYPGALFFSAGGYHHHVGVNIWAGEGAPRPPADAAGLIDWELLVPDPEAVTAVVARLRANGSEPAAAERGWRVEDSAGNTVVLRG